MKTAIKLEPMDVNSIPFQEASLDIWDKKYRLSAKDGTPVDRSMDDTYKRVARALADVEQESVRDEWYEKFLWCLPSKAPGRKPGRFLKIPQDSRILILPRYTLQYFSCSKSGYFSISFLHLCLVWC